VCVCGAVQLLRGLGQEVYCLKVPKLPVRPSRKVVLELRLVSGNAEGCGGVNCWWYCRKGEKLKNLA